MCGLRRCLQAGCSNFRMGYDLRFYDPKIDEWRVVWAGPRRGSSVSSAKLGESSETVSILLRSHADTLSE
jgi:hypothetical protein